MSVNRFRFVSPGIFVNEIDQSQLPREFEDIGPVVVGRSIKGPMMRPVKVQSRLQFEELFGAPIVGGSNVDVWREGNKIAPTYGAFAAEAYLRNAGPLTFVRLGGFQNPNAGTTKGTGAAGWITTNSLSTAATASNGGAFGLYVAPIASNTIDASNQTASLAAIIYVDQGTVQLSGTLLGGSGVGQAAGAWIRASDASSKEFKLVITDQSANTKTKFVNFDENSKLFIRNVLNTNPTKVNNSITTNGEEYWVGETFETTIKNFATSNAAFAGIIVALKSGSVDVANHLKAAEAASTGWVIGQDKETATSWAFGADGEFTAASKPQKLFKFHTLSEDEWAMNNIKISIQDIKVPPNQYVKFGTFSVVIRSMQDTDDQPIVLERFDLCDLDPSSPNYIAKKIGDVYTTWDYTNKRFKELGQYENKSKFIRIEMNRDVDAGSTEQDLLPFGFYGPKIYKPVTISAAANTAATMPTSNSLLNVSFAGVSSSSGIIGSAAFTASFVSPSLPTVSTTSSYYLNDASRIYWGLKTTKTSSKLFNKEMPEYLRTLPASLSENDSALKFSFVFSLDDVSASFSGETVTSARWQQGLRGSGTSYTSNISGSGTLETLLKGINKFTLPLVGGFEGLDVTEKEPFNNTRALVSTATETNSYAFNSVAVAIDAVSDAEVVEMNTLIVPGVKNASLHSKMVNSCETRGDALAILDIQGDYVPSAENTLAEADRKPDVATAVSYVKDTLALNSSYGCAFYPWVLAKDLNSPNTVWLPPSVVALGTFGSTKRFSEVWFAPAGFTRGGLSESQAGGLPVLRVSQKLNTKERDRLYEANINPIVSFPAEGIVVFGQKTLQVTPSALDRINVRRLMIYIKKEISRFASTLLFDQNVQETWNRFLSSVNPFLASVQARLGLSEFKVVLDETTTTAELIDRNIMYAKILLKPARAIEFIALDFVITNTGASFND